MEALFGAVMRCSLAPEWHRRHLLYCEIMRLSIRQSFFNTKNHPQQLVKSD